MGKGLFYNLLSLLLLAGLLFCCVTPVCGEEPDAGTDSVEEPAVPPFGPVYPADESPVSIEADDLHYDQERQTYLASGNVVIASGGTSLRADRVEFDTATGDAQASGGIVLDSPEGTLRGEDLNFNFNTGLGTLREGSLQLKANNFHIAGEEISRISEKTYRLTRGTFSTCDPADPTWKFGARELEVALDGYARGRHGVFYLQDIPILYTPVIFYPVKRERESGLLTPNFGYSTRRGTQLDLAYFWAFARNQDATFYLDYLSELGIGKGVEYRYVFPGENRGTALVYHISGLAGEDDRFAVDWQHSGELPGGGWLAADLEYVNNRDYFKDFGEVAEEYNKDKAQTVIYGYHNWDKLNLAGQVKYTKDLEQSNANTLQRLPELRLNVLRQRFRRTPFYYQMGSSSTYFYRDTGEKGERLLLRPALAAVWHPGDLFALEPEVAYTQRLYWTSGDGSATASGGLPEFRARASSRFARIYPFHGGRISALRHSIEPDMIYEFIPNEGQNDLPEFDTLDRIEQANVLSYGLTSRLTAKLETADGLPEYHEFLYLRLSQEYDIQESRRDPLDPSDTRNPFSALRAEMILRPSRLSHLGVDTRFDPNSDSRDFTTFNAWGGIEDGSGNRLAFDYRYRVEDLNYFSGNFYTSWLKPVYLEYQQRYDFRTQTSLEQVAKLEYRAQCWSLFLTYRNRLEDQEYLVTFALSGLGKAAQFGGSLRKGEEKAP